MARLLRMRPCLFFLQALFTLLSGGNSVLLTDPASRESSSSSSSSSSSAAAADADALAVQVDCPRQCMCQLTANAMFTVNCTNAGIKSNALSKLRLPPNVDQFILDWNHLDTLDADSFSGLQGVHNLSFLSLKGNNISVVDAGAFRGMTSLHTLDLSSNYLEALPEMLFAETPELSILYLHNNPLTAGGVNDSLKHLPNLETLDLAGTPFNYMNISADMLITMLPSNFVYLKQLQHLNLQDTGLNTLGDRFFQPIQDAPLQWLSLAGNSLTKVQNNTFTALKALEFLDLSQTNMDTFTTEDVFKGLKNSSIDTVYLTNVYTLHDLDGLIRQHTFGPLEDTTIRVLHLEHNQNGMRGTISHKLFKHVPSLEELYLDGCMIDAIDYQGFQRLDKLRILSLQQNLLNCVEGCGFLDEPSPLPSLESLDLGSNIIMQLGNDHGVFKGRSFPKLNWLSLRNNRLHSLNRGIFVHLKKLLFLDLSMNPLILVAPGTFHSLPSLQTLQINNCDQLIQLWNGTFQGLSTLVVLELENNNLQRLEADVFSGLDNLQNLSLRGNELENIQIHLESDNLTTLDLGRNMLQKLPLQLLSSVSTTLETVFLDHNRIFSIDSVSFDHLVLPDVTHFDASHNSISRIDASLAVILPGLTVLNLEGNPFLCDCHSRASSAWLRDSNIDVLNEENYFCSGQTFTAKRSNILQYSPSVWQCRAQTAFVPVLSFIMGVLTVTVLFAILVAYRRWRQTFLKDGEGSEDKASSIPWCIPLRPIPTRHHVNGDIETNAASEHLLPDDGQSETLA